VLRQLLAAGLAVPFLERLTRDLPLDKQLRKLASLCLALEWHRLFLELESLLCEAGRTFAELVNPFRGVCLRERPVEIFACLSAQRFQVGALRGRHGLAACLPLIRIALEAWLVRIMDISDGHEANRSQNTSQFLNSTVLSSNRTVKVRSHLVR
jgi:hypothetical protein